MSASAFPQRPRAPRGQTLEERLVDFVVGARAADIPSEARKLVKHVALNVIGAIVAGARVAGCPEVVALARQWGGRAEATILVHGGRVAAGNAAFANSFMARAVGIDEAIVPGIHIAASVVPSALAAAELAGGCPGDEFLVALVVGTEIAARITAATDYGGFDPTGVSGPFGATAAVARVLGLSAGETRHAFGHAFNRSGGSFQGTIDGTIAARVLQAQVSHAAFVNVQLAQHGISGPTRFLEGVYGYLRLFGHDTYERAALVEELGTRFELCGTFLKKYPTCGTTGPAIDGMLDIMKESRAHVDDIASIDVRVTPATFELTGRPFQKRTDPRIDAMYSVQYCVANAALRNSCKLHHFDEPAIDDPDIVDIMKRIRVAVEPALEARAPLATDVEVTLRDGRVFRHAEDFARGMPERPLTDDELMEKLRDCIEYGAGPLAPERIEEALALVRHLEEVKDVRDLAALLATHNTRRTREVRGRIQEDGP